MAFSGFGKNSGPSAQAGAQNPFANFPRHPSPSSPLPVPPRSSIDYRDLDASEGISSRPFISTHSLPGTQNNEPPFRRGDVKAHSLKDPAAQYQRPPADLQQVTSRHLRPGGPIKTAEVQSIRRTSSPFTQSPHEISNASRSPLGSDKSYSDPYGARLSRPVSHNSVYAGGQRPHIQDVQQYSPSPVWVNNSKLSSHNITPPVQERLSPVFPSGGTHQPGPMFKTKHTDGPLQKRTRSPTLPTATVFSSENARSDGPKRSLVDYRDLDAPEAMSLPPLDFESSSFRRESSLPLGGIQKPFPSSLMSADQSKSPINATPPLVREDVSGVFTATASYQPGRKLQPEHGNVQLPKRTRSPTIPSPNGNFAQNPASVLDIHKRGTGFQRRSPSPTSVQPMSAEDDVNTPLEVPAVKRTKIPHQTSPGLVSQENLDPEQEIERELNAKAKRLARFKDELSQPVPSRPTVKNQKDPAKSQQLSLSERQSFSEDPKADMMVDSASGNVFSDYEGTASSCSIVGSCPDMCPESERSERERKGDLDQYERLGGDRNITSEYLAVKKYTRTAEREAELIRPLPILQKTIDYLLNLLDEPYDDRFLGLYNFLWDRMRAIRMDLRMQHIFNLEAITMLEQMIRLHIIAMHELCEYTRGEGFSEGFDAHLNIEQMNKTSVELFQFYDDHRKRGIHVPSEREFRGYYALLKLDKHPGYKVEPAELSLDLAKMTPEMRQTPEVLFARDVARACRTGNFIAFFRLARKASYLQACLMHAHFSKLRTQALASLHCGLQINQGIPISHVAKWLGMEEEDVGDLLEYHGFSMREFEEPYMVKENAFANVESDFPVKRSKLVERKRSRMIVTNVMFPSQTKSYADNEVTKFKLKKDPHPRSTLQPTVAVNTPQLYDREMQDIVTSLSPKSSVQKPMHKASISPITPDKRTTGFEIQEASAGLLVSEFSRSSPKPHVSSVESEKKFKYEPAFRNSFGRSVKHDLEETSAVTLQTAVTEVAAEEDRALVASHDSVVHIPIQKPVFSGDREDEELTEVVEEDTTDEATTSNYDLEVLEARLRLMLRIWKRRTTNRRKLREHKKFTANAAMDLLSLGPPIWQLEVQPGSFGTFNIDRVMHERHENQQRSWSVLNPSDVVASKLFEKNPDAKCICWKLVLCSQEETPHQGNPRLHNDPALLTASSWLLSKLMPANSDGSDDLLVSSPDLAIWRSWTPSNSDDDLTCCLSVITSTNSEDINKSITGASAVLFLLSERISLELQKKQLHDLVALLPSGSRMPLLILSGSDKDESDLANIAKVLGLHDIDKSRVIISCLISLKEVEMQGLDGFFSDKRLREGLEWLARESPPQIGVSRVKTRERVLSHLNTNLKILDGMDIHRVGPNDCISIFNEALDRSMNEVATTAHANPTGWPCPEIDLLEEFTDESMAAKLYLPSVGWSSASRTEVLMSALNDCKLPPLEDDLSWFSRGLGIGGDMGNQKSRLESCLVDYLTEASQMMGEAMALSEAAVLLQSCTSLELHNTTYYIIPRWVSIFRRLFNWRLMKLNSKELSSTYLLLQHSSSPPGSEALNSLESEDTTLLPPYHPQPSLDELVEVGCCPTGLEANQMDFESFQPWSSMDSDSADFPSSRDQVIPQNGMFTSPDISAVEEHNDDGSLQTPSSEAPKDADKLSELLEKCNIIQNMIDKKLSIYF
ncbi:SAC3 family protein B isoform X2 [Salvia miltiorrhiza]|uniref:SAC3 family protein B isoform X2 n=1 Tax=Salvia miltiorrhiza TaxID=226208 RepID=UPI0025AB7464|nr:SAC3 family protein B isoform X2 [Salvia miltiorrhiza]